MTAWVGFILAMIALLVISQKNLGVAMFVGAFILGIATVPQGLPWILWSTVTDPSNLLLALIVGLIPLIGGILMTSGQMDNLVSNMRIGKKAFLMLSPALVGMLPMPGGALLSAPLIERGGENISNEKKAGLNVWFRHVLYLVYPLAPTLIVSTEVAQVDMYEAIPYLVPALFFSLFLGYAFFLRDAPGKMNYEQEFSLKNLLLPLAAILVAPLVDILTKSFFAPKIKESATLLGVLFSLLIALTIGRGAIRELRRTVVEARPWNFALMIMGIMFFLDVFDGSGIPQSIEGVYITREILFVAGFLLGFGTGRIITPAGIVFLVLRKFGAISLPTFAIMYFSIFLGYIITPVHPCVSLSAESFKTGIKDYFKAVLPPTLIALIVSFLLLHTSFLL
ncbi:MAG: DUF401 family protein [Candidatus Bathyarchaeota archaeon]|nr:DUF401 family protein [Candidatus Bathyarchaeota archaeon]